MSATDGLDNPRPPAARAVSGAGRDATVRNMLGAGTGPTPQFHVSFSCGITIYRPPAMTGCTFVAFDGRAVAASGDQAPPDEYGE